MQYDTRATAYDKLTYKEKPRQLIDDKLFQWSLRHLTGPNAVVVATQPTPVGSPKPNNYSRGGGMMVSTPRSQGKALYMH